MAPEGRNMDADPTEYQTPDGPVLCANNCGFFGSVTTNNLCSKCHKDQITKEQSAVAPTIYGAKKASKIGSSSLPFVPATKESVKLNVSSTLNVDENQTQDSCSNQPTNLSAQTECRTTDVPILCANGCGFFVNATTKNLCSRCFKDQMLKQEPVVAPTISGTENASNVGSSALSCETATEKSVESDVPGVVNSDKDQAQGSSSKKPANRCVECQKKVGLTGFKCRCGGTFCSSHRYYESHQCTFDYKTAGREAIAKENPVMKAEKLDKI